MKENNKILFNLVNHFIHSFKIKKTLFLNYSDYALFEGLSKSVTKTLFRGQSIPSDKEKYDLIIGNLPFGMPKKEWVDAERDICIKARRNWIDIFKSLFSLNDSGYGMYIIEPIHRSEEWLKYQEQLRKKGFFVNAIFNTPQEILQPQTFLQPNLIVISRKENPQLFIAELNDLEDLETIINNFKNSFNSESLDSGVLINEDSFRGFSQYKITSEINALKTQYKNYKKYKLKDVALEIILGNMKKAFKDRPNSIYLPKIGTSPVVSRLSDLKIKQQNYFQIVLDENIVKNEYLELFFRSALGKITLKILITESIIPHINKRDLMEIFVSIPNFKEQEILIKTTKKLALIKEKVDIFNNEIAFKPKSARIIQDKIDVILLALDEGTETEKIMRILRTGESKTIEFKQTLSMDVKTGKKEKIIEKAILKTLDAFLNTIGGILLVGVSDNKKITGIQGEIKKYYKNNDKFLLHFKNLVKTKIGENFYPLINYRLVNVENCKILRIDCNPSDVPCYFESKEFYVRTNPATDKLEGPKMVDYIQRHFKKQ